MISNEIKNLRDKYVTAAIELLAPTDIEAVRKAYVSEGGNRIQIDVPNFENVLICGPDANPATEWFKEQISGLSGLTGLGTAIARQFETMDRFDVLVLLDEE